jgi:hypothetical protein
VRALAAMTLAVAVSAGCGSVGGTGDGDDASWGHDSLEALWKRPGEDVGLLQGTSDHAPGVVRISFLVVRGDGEAVFRPRARLWLARGLRERPFLEGTASLERVGIPGGYENDGDADRLYVGHLRIDRPGKYWLLAEPVGGEPIQALGNVVVKPRPASPAIGAPAPASDTPTLEDARGDPSRLTTRVPPDTELLRHSVAETLAARKPFVVVFATPKFCESRTCGPVVDVVDAVRRRHRGTGVRFIHVEIYAGNDPANGVNRWVEEWKLPSEPWVFVVGADGRVKAKFEGSVSVRELEAGLADELAAA